jgi:hypothetical protein
MAVEIEFRDGVHAVPDHVAMLLRLVDTTTMTKQEAIRASETAMVRNHLNTIQRKVQTRHFRENRF